MTNSIAHDAEVAAALRYLAALTETHFGCEEALIDQGGGQEAFTRGAEQDYLIRSLTDYISALDRGTNVCATEQGKRIESWLKMHIARNQKRLAAE